MRKPFNIPKTADDYFRRVLKKIAKYVSSVFDLYEENGVITNPKDFTDKMSEYSVLIDKYAKNVSANMMGTLNRANIKDFSAITKKMAQEKRASSDGFIIERMRELQDRQVGLIKSIPLKAAERAQELAREAQFSGVRSEGLAEKIQEFGNTTEWRAELIAETEVANAHSAITQARSESLGITHYKWRTMGDESVRESHQEMDGKVIAYDEEPTLSDGMTGHAGTFPRCRCYQEPIL